MVLPLYIKIPVIQGEQTLCACAIREVHCAGSGNYPYIKILGGISDRSHMSFGLLLKLLFKSGTVHSL
jgi:hypothetical protein